MNYCPCNLLLPFPVLSHHLSDYPPKLMVVCVKGNSKEKRKLRPVSRVYIQNGVNAIFILLFLLLNESSLWRMNGWMRAENDSVSAIYYYRYYTYLCLYTGILPRHHVLGIITVIVTIARIDYITEGGRKHINVAILAFIHQFSRISTTKWQDSICSCQWLDLMTNYCRKEISFIKV